MHNVAARGGGARASAHTRARLSLSLSLLPSLSFSPLRPDLLRERTRFADTDVLHPSKITDRDATDRRVGASPSASAAARGGYLAGYDAPVFGAPRAGTSDDLERIGLNIRSPSRGLISDADFGRGNTEFRAASNGR